MDRVLGSYRLVQALGRGGMGEVWQAEHVKIGRCTAIKILHPQFSRQPEMLNRFFNEARAATAISDPGIVQVYDFGEDVDGTAFIVMEMLYGETLDCRLRRSWSLSVAEALRLARQVASSLGAAHAAGIVHRDLKPENIFIVHDPEVVGGERTKILDFGIAKLATSSTVKTQTAALMGTPMYMSPEQCRGAGQVDARSDIYSLGCVLFAALAGRPPFVADGAGEVIAMHLREEPPRLKELVPGIAPALDRLIADCLAKDPALRPASTTVLSSALGAHLNTTDALLGRATQHSASPFVTTPPTTLSSASSQLNAPLPESRKPLIAVGAAVALLAIVLAIVVGRRGREKAPAVLEPVDASVQAVATPTDAAVSIDAAVDAFPAIDATVIEIERPHPRRVSRPSSPQPQPKPPSSSSLQLGPDGLPESR